MNCKICKSKNVRRTSLTLSGNIPLFQCLECGLKFLVLSKEFNEESDYWCGANKDIYLDPFVRSALSKKYNRHLSILKKKDLPNKLLLDVGSGIGIFVYEAYVNGFDPSGIEPSKTATDIAKEQSFPFYLGYLTSDDTLPKEYGIITAWDVIEHVPDPFVFIKACSDHLTNNGILLLETPNESSLLRKIVQICAPFCFWTRDIRKNIYYHTHRYYFTIQAMSTLLTELGFKEIDIYYDFTVFEKSLLKLKWQRNYSNMRLKCMQFFYSILKITPLLSNKMVIFCRKSNGPV